MQTQELLRELKSLTHRHLLEAIALQSLSFSQLNNRIQENKWSILECVEHLNLYGTFYLPEVKKNLHANSPATNTDFRPGILGNYFAKSMLPKDRLNKMKTFKSMNPLHRNLEITVIDTFVHQLEEWLKILEMASKVDLNKVKTSISISKLIRLKMGDTLRVVIYHNERHMKQIENLLKSGPTN